ncbi:hypothetical protein BDR07DRAFT_1274477 [Suillus spraguei]|nr:hypothetical protein BDR07DRAFT_1274477 [Suillus spraguei]
MMNLHSKNIPLNKHLHRLKKSPFPYCPYCPQTIEIVHHFPLQCPNHQDAFTSAVELASARIQIRKDTHTHVHKGISSSKEGTPKMVGGNGGLVGVHFTPGRAFVTSEMRQGHRESH